MPLSANSLFHFTKTKDALYGILDETFKLSYCREDLVVGGERFSIRVPMVSFCDIPLSAIKNHIVSYGSYGLGLGKGWGKRRKLNPVLYIEQELLLSQSYKMALKRFVLEEAENSEVTDPDKLALLDMLRYIKNYEGRLRRGNGERISKYRFSDEREWRFVPKFDEDIMMILEDRLYQRPEIQEMVMTKISPLRLGFSADDVRYIVVENDSEINGLVDHLRHIKNPRYSLEVVDRLTTRILTRDQIMEDI
jgi:hypothetical protein